MIGQKFRLNSKDHKFPSSLKVLEDIYGQGFMKMRLKVNFMCKVFYEQNGELFVLTCKWEKKIIELVKRKGSITLIV